MDQQLKEAKRAIRAFWPNYSDERLAWLLAHARSGRLSYFSCCCFIGVATADHALRGDTEFWQIARASHYTTAEELPGAAHAEEAFAYLSDYADGDIDVAKGRRRIIPMILAEMRRRDRLRATELPLSVDGAELYASATGIKW